MAEAYIAATALSFASGQAEKKENAENNRASLEAKAKALGRKAAALDSQGAIEEVNVRSQKDAVIGSIVSAAVGSGVVASTGSVLDVIEESAFNIEMDALTARNNLSMQANDARIEAGAARAAKPGKTNLVKTLLGGPVGAISGIF